MSDPTSSKISTAKTPLQTIAYTYATYKFMQILTTPWDEQDAYKYGIIDDKGEVLRSYDDLTTIDEKNSFTLFHRLVFNIKRIFTKVPFVRSKIGTLATALFLIRESKIVDVDIKPILEHHNPDAFQSVLTESTQFQFSILRAGLYCLKTDTIDSTGEMIPEGTIIDIKKDMFCTETFMGFKMFVVETDSARVVLTHDILESEMAADNAMTTTSVGNVDQPVGQNPLGKAKRHRFAGVDVFDVNRDVWIKSRLGKPKYHRYAPYVGMDDVGDEIRSYALANPTKKIILRDDQTGSMIYLRR